MTSGLLGIQWLTLALDQDSSGHHTPSPADGPYRPSIMDSDSGPDENETVYHQKVSASGTMFGGQQEASIFADAIDATNPFADGVDSNPFG